jgi:hypothetical protein
MWNAGVVCSNRVDRDMSDCRAFMRAVSTSARWRHGTPFGLPVVPLVYQSTA